MGDLESLAGMFAEPGRFSNRLLDFFKNPVMVCLIYQKLT